MIPYRVALAALIPVCLFAVFSIANWEALTLSCQRGNDQELLSFNVELAKQGKLLTGAYSNSHFRHPGPFFSYYLAFFDVLLPQSWTQNGRLVSATLLFHALTFSAGLAIATSLLRLRVGFVLLAAILVACTSFGSQFHFSSYWNPWVVPSVFFVFLLSAAGLADGRLRYFPPMVLAGSIAIQSHIGTLPASLVVGVLALGWYFRTLQREGAEVGDYRIWSLSLALFALLWFPVVIDSIVFDGFGNVGRLARALSSDSVQGRTGEVGSFILNAIVRHPVRGTWLDSSIGLPAVGFALLFLPLLLFRTLRSTEQKLAVILLVASVISIYAATQTSARLTGYRLSYFQAITALSYFLALLSFGRFLESRGETLRPVQLALVFAGGVWGAWMTWNHLPPAVSHCPCGRLESGRDFVAELNPDPAKRYQIHSSADRQILRSLNPVLIELARRRVDFCVEDSLGYRFSDTVTCSYVERTSEPKEVVEVAFSDTYPTNECVRDGKANKPSKSNKVDL